MFINFETIFKLWISCFFNIFFNIMITIIRILKWFTLRFLYLIILIDRIIIIVI